MSLNNTQADLLGSLRVSLVETVPRAPGFYKTFADDAGRQLSLGAEIPDRNHVANLSIGLGEGVG